jgi:branched-chain amino acid transport system permease protein
VGPLTPDGPQRTFYFAYVAWLVAIAALVITRNLVRSRPGRGLRALATSEAGALGSGVPVGKYKLQVFALSAALAGIAGGVYAFFTEYISPGSFPVLLSIQFLIMATVGGLGSVWGAAVGTAVVYLVVQLFENLGTAPGMPVRAPAIFSYALYALVLIAIMLLLPRGLVPTVQGWFQSRRQTVGREIGSY